MKIEEQFDRLRTFLDFKRKEKPKDALRIKLCNYGYHISKSTPENFEKKFNYHGTIYGETDLNIEESHFCKGTSRIIFLDGNCSELLLQVLDVKKIADNGYSIGKSCDEVEDYFYKCETLGIYRTFYDSTISYFYIMGNKEICELAKDILNNTHFGILCINENKNKNNSLIEIVKYASLNKDYTNEFSYSDIEFHDDNYFLQPPTTLVIDPLSYVINENKNNKKIYEIIDAYNFAFSNLHEMFEIAMTTFLDDLPTNNVNLTNYRVKNFLSDDYVPITELKNNGINFSIISFSDTAYLKNSNGDNDCDKNIFSRVINKIIEVKNNG